MQEKRLSDGSYLVAPDGENLHLNHIHLSADRITILSHKNNGVHSYKYSDTRQDLSKLWEEITGEKNKFSGGWKAK
ncbi:MAG: hypothetical protein IJ881_07460 [Neisseriaceae bacterium]|nr:hypothetical protein [Neisseriaceae bacterium]MBR3425806.1 hypothetical protein [Neisseriaceae bacterium]